MTRSQDSSQTLVALVDDIKQQETRMINAFLDWQYHEEKADRLEAEFERNASDGEMFDSASPDLDECAAQWQQFFADHDSQVVTLALKKKELCEHLKSEQRQLQHLVKRWESQTGWIADIDWDLEDWDHKTLHCIYHREKLEHRKARHTDSEADEVYLNIFSM
jgi:transcriptional regulator of heat shock response